jgi:hypothetical protein
MRDELEAREYPEPFYSMMRSPYDHILSRYWYRTRGKKKELQITLEKFISIFEETSHGTHLNAGIAMYHEYVDRYFLFEDGLRSFFDKNGFPGVEIYTCGKNRIPKDHPRLRIEDLDPKYKDLIDKKFHKDVKLYQRAVAEQR